MRKISNVVALIIAVVFIVGVSFVAEAKKEAKAPKEKVIVAKGEVTKVDAAANTVTIKKAGKTPEEITLNVTPETVVKIGKEKKALADIKAGDKVKAMYVKDTMAAKSIFK
jgi:Cu/Ag efflux protein CusF